MYLVIDLILMCEGNLSHSLLIYQQSVLCLFVLQLESLNQSELASRLTMNCQNSYVEPHKIKDIAVTIMDVGLLYTLYWSKVWNSYDFLK